MCQVAATLAVRAIEVKEKEAAKQARAAQKSKSAAPEI